MWGFPAHAAPMLVTQPPPPPPRATLYSAVPPAHGHQRMASTSTASCSVVISEVDSDDGDATDLPSSSAGGSFSGSAGPTDLDSSCASPHGEHCEGTRCGDEEASVSAATPPGDTGWGSLTVGILQAIVGRLGGSESKGLRSVCRHWRNVVDHHLEALTPSELQAKVLVSRFPNLKSLHLTNCSNIRNRSLLIISRAGLALHTLTLGDDVCRPWVTNEGLACIATMTSLTALNLHECNGVTNNGLNALTNLPCLSALSLKGCRKLTNGAFETLACHPALTELNLYGCRLTDKGLLPLTGLRLVSLRLGNTRVSDEGLSYLARITTLRELHFDHEELSDVGVAQLSTLTRLESLALRDCDDVSGDSLSVLIPALPNLISLDLNKNFTIDDSQLTRCLEFLGAVTFLDLRGTPVTDGGLSQLTRLSCLQKLCLAPTNERLWTPYLCVVSSLTQLTSLSINNCTPVSFGQLDVLRQLKLLRELDLSHDLCSGHSHSHAGGAWGGGHAHAHGGAHHGAQPHGGGGAGASTSGGALSAAGLLGHQQACMNPTAVDAVAAITSLTSIDLSRRPVNEEHLSALAERLPRLHNLIIVGCPVLYTEVQALQRRFPGLAIHRKPQHDSSISCCVSKHGVG
ncbi:hypothetical protein FOA52_007972 [Chlamydomonas sp. UWO 241]|nr:hypothetical protein FOA52_007972 [Chlamydomonas sp. UWO 241]